MNTRFIIFITVITTITILATSYLALRFISSFGLTSPHARIVWIGVVTFILLQVLGPLLYRVMPTQTNAMMVLHWVTYTTMGLFACILLYTAVTDIALLVIKRIVSPDFDIERRSFLGVLGLTAASGAIGAVNAIRGPNLFEVDVPIEGLPKEFDGFKIVQISDLHIGPTIRKPYAEMVVEMANAQKPDMIALTGDFIDGSPEDLLPHLEPLKNLKATHGLFYTTGNHEYYWEAKRWIDVFKSFGASVLLNEHKVIKQGDSQLVIAGVTDTSGGEFYEDHVSDPIKSVAGAPQNSKKILLAHQPKSFAKAFEAGIDLQLSGHTHAGQFFPFSLFMPLAHKYYKGLNLHAGKMWVYVNRGTGYWGPPLRFGVSSEVTLIRLKST